MQYLIVFAISIFFAWQAEIKMEKRKKCVFLFVLAIAGPVLLAGLRDSKIGIDVMVYVLPFFKRAQYSISILDFFSKLDDGTEYGYLTYLYLITKAFNSFFIVMLTNHLVIVSACMYVLISFKRLYGNSIWFGYAIFLLHFYNPSLCLIRQGMALMIVLIGLCLLIEKRYFSFVLSTAVSVLIHGSMLAFSLPILFLYIIKSYVKTLKFKIISFTALFISTVYASSLIEVMKKMVSVKYADRIAQYDSNSGGLGTIIVYSLFALIPFVICFLKKKKIKQEFFLYLPFFGVAFQILGKYAVYLSRLAVPFMLTIMLTIPFVLKNKSQKTVFLLLLLVMWIMNIYIRNDWETIPYVMGNYFGI